MDDKSTKKESTEDERKENLKFLLSQDYQIKCKKYDQLIDINDLNDCKCYIHKEKKNDYCEHIEK